MGVNMVCLCCEVCLGWTQGELGKTHPAQRKTGELSLVSESRWGVLHFPSVPTTALPWGDPITSISHSAPKLLEIQYLTRGSTLSNWPSLNNTQLLACVALIMWTVEEKKKSISQMLAKRIWGARRGHLPSLWQMRGDSNARQSPYGYIL